MKRMSFFLTVCVIIVSALFLSACDELGLSNIKDFDYTLRGTWVSEDKTLYSGTITINYKTIRVDGYGENQGNDYQRPFKGIHKNVNYNGYSEEGKIFFEDAGVWPDGLPYTYRAIGSYPKTEFLEFTFGGRKESLRRQPD